MWIRVAVLLMWMIIIGFAAFVAAPRKNTDYIIYKKRGE